MRELPEPDWKVFRQVREVALTRFCQQVLDELAGIGSDAEKTPHERYLVIYQVIHERDRTLAEAFDGARRSRALMQLLSLSSHRLITPAELGRFSAETQALVANFAR